MRLTVPPDLVDAARGGERGAIEKLLEALWPHAYRIARSIVQDDALAEDAAQEACAILYRRIAGLCSNEAFRAWAYRIVVREAVRAAKRAAASAVPRMPARTAETDVETRIDVLHALNALAPDLRAVVVLHYYAELSSGEIGAFLGIPSPTIRFRLARARQQLKQILSPEQIFLTAEASQ